MSINKEIETMLASIGKRFEILELHSSSVNNFEVTFRTELPSHIDGPSAQCDGWVKAFSDVSKSRWIVNCTWPRAKRFKYRKMYICQYSSKGKSSPRSKNRHCKASMSIKIEGSTTHTRKGDHLIKQGLDTEIKICFKHTHPINVAAPYSFLQMSDDTKLKFIQYFNEGMTSAAAKQYHEMKLISESTGDTNIEELLANTQHNPRNGQVYRLFHHWRTNYRHFVDVQNIKQETLNEMDYIPEEAVHPESTSEFINMEGKLTHILQVTTEETNMDHVNALQRDKSTETEDLEVVPCTDGNTENDMSVKRQISTQNLGVINISHKQLSDLSLVNIKEDNFERKRRKTTKRDQENVNEINSAAEDVIYSVSDNEIGIEDNMVKKAHAVNCLCDIEQAFLKQEKIPELDTVHETVHTLVDKGDAISIENFSQVTNMKEKSSAVTHTVLQPSMHVIVDKSGFITNLQNKPDNCTEIEVSNIQDIMCLQSVQQNIMSLLPSGMSILLNNQHSSWQNIEASCSVSEPTIQQVSSSEKDKKLSKLWNNFSKITSLVEANYPLLSNLTSRLIDRLEIVESAAQLVVLFSDMVASIPPKHMCPALPTDIEDPSLKPRSRKRKKR